MNLELSRLSKYEGLVEYCEMIVDRIRSVSQQVEFDEDTHTYSLNGKKFHSVTTILNQITHYKFFDVPQNLMNWKARVGTMTHTLAEMLYENKTMTFDEYYRKVDPYGFWGKDYKNFASGYFHAMLSYWRVKKPSFFASEIKIIDEEQALAGTIDNLRVDIIHPTLKDPETYFQFSVSDWKVSAKIDVFTQALQLCAYAIMLNNILGIKVFTHAVLVQLRKDGTFKEYWFEVEEYVQRWTILKNNFDANILPVLG